MIILEDFKEKIKKFIKTSVEKFSIENRIPKVIGIYCCPWAGWMTTNFNLHKTIKETYENCPDFEFVAYTNLDLSEWQDEYESDEPAFKNENTTYYHDVGNEDLNIFIFKFLEPLTKEIKDEIKSEIFLQLLDSNCYKIIR